MGHGHSEVTFVISLLITTEGPRDPLGRRCVTAHKATFFSLEDWSERLLGRPIRVLRGELRSFILRRVRS